MQFTKFSDSFKKTRESNKLLMMSNIVLALVVVVLSISVFMKKEIVTIKPPGLKDEATIGDDFASQTYIEAWALYMAQSLGNVTPETAKFVKSAVAPLIAPGIYQETINALERQIQDIRSNKVSLSFEPRRIIHERETSKVFVHGQSILESPTGDRTRKERTYEFKISVHNYMPYVAYLDTYTGAPRTLEELEKIERQASRRSGANKTDED